MSFVETKLYASREVWVHVTGQVKAPIKVTRHVPDSSCERGGCHPQHIAKTITLGSPAPVPFRHGSEGHAKQLCIACHGDQHNGLTTCVDGHTIQSWTPSKFTQPQEGEHIPNGETPLACNACHQNGFGQPAGCPCHGGNPPSGD